MPRNLKPEEAGMSSFSKWNHNRQDKANNNSRDQIKFSLSDKLKTLWIGPIIGTAAIVGGALTVAAGAVVLGVSPLAIFTKYSAIKTGAKGLALMGVGLFMSGGGIAMVIASPFEAIIRPAQALYHKVVKGKNPDEVIVNMPKNQVAPAPSDNSRGGDEVVELYPASKTRSAAASKQQTLNKSPLPAINQNQTPATAAAKRVSFSEKTTTGGATSRLAPITTSAEKAP